MSYKTNLIFKWKNLTHKLKVVWANTAKVGCGNVYFRVRRLFSSVLLAKYCCYFIPGWGSSTHLPLPQFHCLQLWPWWKLHWWKHVHRGAHSSSFSHFNFFYFHYLHYLHYLHNLHNFHYLYHLYYLYYLIYLLTYNLKSRDTISSVNYNAPLLRALPASRALLQPPVSTPSVKLSDFGAKKIFNFKSNPILNEFLS